MKRIFFFFYEKEAYGVDQCKKANYDLILTVPLLFALIFFKDPEQCNHLPIYGGPCAFCVDKVLIQYVTPPHVTSCDHVIKQSCDFPALTINHHSANFDGHTLCESVNVANHENYN